MWSPTRTRAWGECLGEGERSCKSSWRGGKCEEERVSLCVHLDAIARSAGISDDLPVLGESFRVPFRSQFVQQLRRSLDIREEEGDGAGRKVLSHDAIIRRAEARVQSHSLWTA